MSINIDQPSVVTELGSSVEFSSLVSISSNNNPAYLVVSGLDRDEYTASSNGDTGTINGNGAIASFAQVEGDSAGLGIVFTYDAATGQYFNSAYGDLSDLTFTASTDPNRNEAISFYASDDGALLSQYANDPYALAQYAASAYLGTISVVTDPGFLGPVPTQATPDSICAAAASFVGQTWNDNGCWVLASEIAAEAGASLPLSSTLLGASGQSNGEWIVAYNGPAGQTGNWRSMVKAGEMVVFETSFTSGHITTVVSGSGANAEVIDNIAYVNADGSIANAAADGSPDDIVIAGPHAASDEFAEAMSGSVVIYELDTPTISLATQTASVATGATMSLGSLISATDPADKAITEYQVYDTETLGATGDSLVIDGAEVTANSAGAAVTFTAGSLSSLTLAAGEAVGTDTVEIRASNGTYWGDWQSLTVDITDPEATTPAVVSVSEAETFAGNETVAVADTAANVQGGLSDLTAVAPNVSSITLTDGQVNVSVAAFAADEAVLDKIVGGFAVTDTAANIQPNLAALEADANNIVSITSIGGGVGGTNTPVTVTIADFNADEAALNKLSSGFGVSDTAANIIANLDALRSDVAQITTIAATDVPVAVSVATSTADKSVLDKISAGFDITDQASTIASKIGALAADGDIDLITAENGMVTTSVTTFESYQSALDEIAGGFAIADTAAHISASLDQLNDANVDLLRIVNDAAIGVTSAQLINDATAIGKLQDANASVVRLTAAALSFSGNGQVTIDDELICAGAFSETDTTLSLTGGELVLEKSAHFVGGVVNGTRPLVIEGATSVSGLTIGGAAMFYNSGVTTQSGGGLTLGDASGAAANLINRQGATYDIVDNSGIDVGTSASSLIRNAGLFEKTSGSGVSAIAAPIANSGTIEVSHGTLDLQGAILGRGALTIRSAGALQIDSVVGHGQSLDFLGSGGELVLDDFSSFAATIAGFGAHDSIDIAGSFNVKSFVENVSGTGGVLTFSNGSINDAIHLLGQYAAAGFESATGPGGTTLITYSEPPQSALLLTAGHH